MKCRHCNGICTKKGKSASGKQRFKCKECDTYQLQSYTHLAHLVSDTSIKTLVKEGCGIRSISRILKISKNTALNRILSISKKISKPTIYLGREYEMDEMRTYIQRKDRLIWIAYALCRDTKEIVDFRVGRRTNKTLKGVLDSLSLSQATKVYTDKLKNYQYLIDKKIHRTTFKGTNGIERMNLNLRTHLKRLNRRSICFSKSHMMLIACLKIYFWS